MSTRTGASNPQLDLIDMLALKAGFADGDEAIGRYAAGRRSPCSRWTVTLAEASDIIEQIKDGRLNPAKTRRSRRVADGGMSAEVAVGLLDRTVEVTDRGGERTVTMVVTRIETSGGEPALVGHAAHNHAATRVRLLRTITRWRPGE